MTVEELDAHMTQLESGETGVDSKVVNDKNLPLIKV